MIFAGTRNRLMWGAALAGMVAGMAALFMYSGRVTEIDASMVRMQAGEWRHDGKSFTGIAVSRHENGAIAGRTFFRNGKRFGKAEEWYADGRQKALREYDEQGESHGIQREWWPNGRLKLQMNFEYGNLESDMQEWSPNGVLMRKLHYVKGKQEGEQLGWNVDGQPKFSYTMRDGRRYGVIDSTPCAVPALKADDKLPYYENALFAPKWLSDLPHGTPSHQIAGFRLQDQSGGTLTEKALDARITIVNLFFAGCSSTCPVTMQHLKILREAMGKEAPQFVSISVSPLSDDVQALAAYGHRMGIAGNWHLLTGTSFEVYKVLGQGFFSDMKNGSRAGSHTEKAFLVDAQRRIRGVYNATQPADIRRLEEDIKVLKAAIS